MGDSGYSYLTSLGSFYPLNICFKWNQLQEQLRSCDSLWRPYNPSKPEIKREGLSLLSLDGSTDGTIDLNSLREYNEKNNTSYNELSFRTVTESWDKLPIVSDQMQKFSPYLGRSHFIRFGAGGFFPPHRDLGNCFRLISFFNCTPSSLAFLIDDKKIFFECSRLYFADTRKIHSLFSFQPDTMILVFNVEITNQAIELVESELRQK